MDSMRQDLPFFGNADILAGTGEPDDQVGDEEADHTNLKRKVIDGEF